MTTYEIVVDSFGDVVSIKEEAGSLGFLGYLLFPFIFIIVYGFIMSVSMDFLYENQIVVYLISAVFLFLYCFKKVGSIFTKIVSPVMCLTLYSNLFYHWSKIDTLWAESNAGELSSTWILLGMILLAPMIAMILSVVLVILIKKFIHKDKPVNNLSV